jgi:hypothetical protein
MARDPKIARAPSGAPHAHLQQPSFARRSGLREGGSGSACYFAAIFAQGRAALSP